MGWLPALALILALTGCGAPAATNVSASVVEAMSGEDWAAEEESKKLIVSAAQALGAANGRSSCNQAAGRNREQLTISIRTSAAL